MKNVDNLNNQINYKENKTSLEKVGSFLREARQGRNISIEELSGSLRIGKEQLIALENGQEDLLPEMVFVKAMIRRISEKLNIETNFVLDELKGRDISVNKLYEMNQINEEKLSTNIWTPIMIVISGILGITASFFTINYLQDSLPSLNPETDLGPSSSPRSNK